MSMSRRAAVGFVAVAGAMTLALGTPAVSAAPTVAVQRVGLNGTFVTVPATWPVYDLAKRPGTCVRFDRHAVYVGSPGAQPDCPVRLIGHTEAVLLEPAGGAPDTMMADTPNAGAYDRVAAGVHLSVTYGRDRATARQIVASATPVGASSTRAPSVARAGAQPVRPAPRPPSTLPGSATAYTGKGFDACTAPSAPAMSAWLSASPYRAIGVYIGGENRACGQPNLTPAWVAQQAGAGWHFNLLYVGKQAPTSGCGCSAIVDPGPDGQAAAEDAVAKAAALGFGPGSPIVFDLEAYTSASTATVLAFLSSWTTRLHANGYRSGVYSSSNSGINDLALNYASFAMPDMINVARWNDVADTNDPNVPANRWANRQRIHQYQGPHDETYGGVRINIDLDYWDLHLSPAPPRRPAGA